MAGKVNPIPEEYRGATPYLCVKEAARAIEFYKSAFGAREVMRMAQPLTDGSASRSCESAQRRSCSPTNIRENGFFKVRHRIGGTPVNILVYVEDVDSLVKRATADGAKLLRAVADQFYGDRVGVLEDPLDIVGLSRRTSKTSRPRKCKSAQRHNMGLDEKCFRS